MECTLFSKRAVRYFQFVFEGANIFSARVDTSTVGLRKVTGTRSSIHVL